MLSLLQEPSPKRPELFDQSQVIGGSRPDPETEERAPRAGAWVLLDVFEFVMSFVLRKVL